MQVVRVRATVCCVGGVEGGEEVGRCGGGELEGETFGGGEKVG